MKMLEVRVNRAHFIGSTFELYSSHLRSCLNFLDPPSIFGILFVISSPSATLPLSAKASTSDLFDQSALSTLAQRLVEAARRAGADAADAVAVRGVSQGVEVRDGRVEESERSEGDDVGLRVLVGRRQAVVSTNDVSGDGVARLAERAVAMARVAPDDKYVGLADPSLLAREFPDLDLLDPKVPSTSELERRACEAEAAALAVKGVTKSGGASASAGIGGMVLVTSTGFHGSYLRSSQGISMTAISGDGTGMERDYDYTTAPHASDLASPESVGRTAGERTVARANPRKVETCKVPVVFDPRVSGSLVGHLVGALNGASIARKTSFLRDRMGEQTPAELISDIKQGFYVTDLIGSGVNGVTGDYSRGASGFWIENGEITYAVSEVTIAGHLIEMFKSLAPASDLEFRYSVNAPTLRIEGLTVGGR